jgi:hypothetical protein
MMIRDLAMCFLLKVMLATSVVTILVSSLHVMEQRTVREYKPGVVGAGQGEVMVLK